MKLKKYVAKTEETAMELVNLDLGDDALILNVKKIEPRGINAIFKKGVVEVTAVQNDSLLPKTRPTDFLSDGFFFRERLERALSDPTATNEEFASKTPFREYSVTERKSYKNKYAEVIYNALLEQDVNAETAEYLLEEVEKAPETVDLEFTIKIVYAKILRALGEPAPINIKNSAPGNPKIAVFIGPTGVGKTTTIAKLSSLFILNEGAKLALITSDTYRIAAIEQLKTYAEILDIDIKVAYDPVEIIKNVNEMRTENDAILIDTAGRSHRNADMMRELQNFLQYAPEAEKFLVLSLTTKSEDLINIISEYSEFTDFRIIFTKLDETNRVGAILNACYKTGKRLAYIANGQSVPDDIETADPAKIARRILGM
jgi:flagellar biosynthesis protein FlhF